MSTIFLKNRRLHLKNLDDFNVLHYNQLISLCFINISSVLRPVGYGSVLRYDAASRFLHHVNPFNRAYHANTVLLLRQQT